MSYKVALSSSLLSVLLSMTSALPLVWTILASSTMSVSVVVLKMTG